MKCWILVICIYVIMCVNFQPDQTWQGWAILEELYCNTILGWENCRELVKMLALENFIGENWSSPQEAGKELVNPWIFNNSNKVEILVKTRIYYLSSLTFPFPSKISCLAWSSTRHHSLQISSYFEAYTSYCLLIQTRLSYFFFKANLVFISEARW